VTRKAKEVVSLAKLLATFRGVETQETSLVILGDDEAVKVLIAWSNVDNEWTQPETRVPDATVGKLGKLWSWILSGWDVDTRKVSRLAGVTEAIAHVKLEILMGNRLIYPDGQMSKGARTALMAHTAIKLGIKQKAATPPMPKKKEKEDDDDESKSN
jgi:hypothetical protein